MDIVESSKPPSKASRRWAWTAIAVLACFWGSLIYQLSAQWSVYEDYRYGFAVPFLCGYLLYERWRCRPASVVAKRAGTALTIALGLLLLLAPIRWLHEANPIWRLTSLAWALDLIGLTACALYWAGGGSWLRHFIFPFAFFLVAIPLPSALQGLVTQGLMRLNVAVTVELLGWLGVPALQRGNVIETSMGMVGIDEACSGIRSLQASIMIALFLGELYRFRASRRALLLMLGGLCAFGFNVGRTLLLAWLEATRGSAEMARWHDPAGVGILIGCFLSLWGIAAWWRRNSQSVSTPGPGEPSPLAEASHAPRPVPVSLRTSVVMLGVWLVVIEAGNEVWYRWHESESAAGAAWHIEWPKESPEFQALEIPASSRAMLQYDQGSSAQWSDAQGRRWMSFYLRWEAGRDVFNRVRVHLAKSHNPEICLPGAGWKLRSDLGWARLPAGDGFALPFHRYLFENDRGPIFVFFSATEDMRGPGLESIQRMGPRDRVRAALAGSRNFGQRYLEIAVVGCADLAEAEAAVRAELLNLVVIDRKASK